MTKDRIDPGTFYWANHTSASLAEMALRDPVAVLPVGAIEQHGPHLPLSVDTDINRGLVFACVERLSSLDLPVLFLPTLPVGKSNEHIDFPGTLTLSAKTVIAMWSEIGECVAATGIRRLVFFNSHGGQIAPMDIVARDLRIKHDILTFSCTWSGLGLPRGLISAHEEKYGIHAGELETAMMLHLHANKCKMENAMNFRSRVENLDQTTNQLGLGPGGKLGWRTKDLNVHGACGDASKATVETGRQAIDFVADRMVELLQDVLDFDMKDRG